MPNRGCTDGLDYRCRDEDGLIREKRGDTLVGTLREIYGPEFLSGLRSDATLETVRQRTGKSLAQLVRDHGRR